MHESLKSSFNGIRKLHVLHDTRTEILLFTSDIKRRDNIEYIFDFENISIPYCRMYLNGCQYYDYRN